MNKALHNQKYQEHLSSMFYPSHTQHLLIVFRNRPKINKHRFNVLCFAKKKASNGR